MHFKRLPKLVVRTPTYTLHHLSKDFSMQDLIHDPLFLSAIYIASPVLYDQLLKYKAGTLDKAVDKSKIEKSLLRYYLRMSSRCTPFGLFAACGMASFGKAGSKNIISEAASKLKRCSRLDMDFLCLLTEHLTHIPEISRQLTYYPNSSLYKFGNEWRYVGYDYKDGVRLHEINSISQSVFTNSLLSAATTGITLTTASSILLALDSELSTEEITSYFDELIASRVLISNIEPAITGSDCLQRLIIELQSLPRSAFISHLVDVLTSVHEKLHCADQMEVGEDCIAKYKEIVTALGELNLKFEEARLFQVDAFWNTGTQFQVGDNLGADLDACVDLFHLFSSPVSNENLEHFKKSFSDRYEQQELPLLQVLDKESGIAYPHDSPDKHKITNNQAALSWGWWEQMLSSKFLDACKRGAAEILFTEEEVNSIREKRAGKGAYPDTPPSFSVLCRQVDLVEAGDKAILIESAGGASAASILGRFAQGNAEIASYVKDICATEQQINKDVVFAEIIHLPQNRVGNVLLHPPFRDKELPYLGISSLPFAQQVSMDDLRVSVKNGRIFLRSASLNQEIIPRLSNSHNYSVNAQPIYNFLCDLQYQGISAGFQLNLGSLTQVYKVLPRIRYRNIVLHPRQWSFTNEELSAMLKLQGQEKYNAFRQFCATWDLPSLFILADSDMELPVCVQKDVQIDNFLSIVKTKKKIILKEFLLGMDGCISDANNHAFNCQFIVNYIKNDAVYQNPHFETLPGFPDRKRTFLPGTRWLYLKIYCGEQTTDRILKECIAAGINRLRKANLIDKWFFIRYRDPDHHIRLRVRSSQGPDHSGTILKLLYKYVGKYEQSGILWKVTIDTYRREVERYKGLIERAESVFCYDSDAVLSFLCLENATAFTRWKYAVMSIDNLLECFHFGLEEKYLLASQIAIAYNQEFKIGDMEKLQVNAGYREKEKQLKAILKVPYAPGDPLYAILQKRQKAMGATAKSIMKRYSCQQQRSIFFDLIGSFVHMLINRIYPSNARYEEMMIYNQLERCYQSQMARLKYSKQNLID